MGQSQSTPLSLFVERFQDVKRRGHDLSVEVKKNKLIKYCSSEWPTFDVGWLRTGSLDTQLVRKVKRKILSPGQGGHPDQIPYIIVWEDLVEKPPEWLRPFISHKPDALVVKETQALLATGVGKGDKKKVEILQNSQTYPSLEELGNENPPPYAPVPVTPEGAISSSRVTSATELGSPPGRDEPQGVNNGVPGRTQQEEYELRSSSVQIYPLRALRSRPDRERTYQYWPFSSSDLYNWKSQNPSFSEKPVALIDLVESILFTHNPTWDDCQQLLKILFTTEERERILAEARKHVPGVDGRPTTQPHLIDDGFPLTRPPWDFDQAEGRERLRIYRQTLMAGLRAAARKPTSLAKVIAVRQEPKESPAAFLERVLEAFRQYTPLDPMAEENRAAVILAFVNQAAPDIRKKLQKIDRLGEQTVQDLLKVAEKVYNNRETPEERQERIRKEDREFQARENRRN
uniref:Core shell protein Gag P30 domain-containing protein n=1 Tax=Nothoprocta perdicaria TaxID=30464 RepID=A0A8C6YUC6_NOTPE